MRMITKICLLSLFVVAACDTPSAPSATDSDATPSGDAAPLAALRDRLAAPSRPAADRARDSGRRPADVVRFLGIEAGDRVIDLVAAGGYCTEVLSLAVGPDGRVVAQNPAAVLEFRDGANDKALSERLRDDRLPNVTRLDKNFDELAASDGPFDVALTALNFHDIYNRSGPEAAADVFRTVHTLLVPGGILGIIDHEGDAGADNRSLHRVEKGSVIETAEAAGFVLAGDSDLLANPDDDRTAGVFTEGLRGRTDRFLLRFTRPAD